LTVVGGTTLIIGARRRALLASASCGYCFCDRSRGCLGAAGRDPPLN
jgi:hypothetical protein